MSYTKGHWRTVIREDGSVYQEKGNPLVGAHCAYDISDDPERGYFKADHALENAAPDMYEALLAIVESHNRLGKISGAAASLLESALAKAEGRP